jgi:putative Mg2+ transporter-C (MgtC) family protein
MSRTSAVDMALRLLAATAAGAVLGVPASARKRAGGIRTHALVTLGAALFCLTGSRVGADRGELMRIIQGVATGVGFVGAATVIKRAGYILGVTTAASIWIAGAVGCEIGLDDLPAGILIALGVSALNGGILALQRRFGTGGFRRMRLPPPGTDH